MIPRLILYAVLSLGLALPAYSQNLRMMDGPASILSAADLSNTYYVWKGKYYRLVAGPTDQAPPVFAPVTLVIIHLDNVPVPTPVPVPDPIDPPVPPQPIADNPFPLPGLRMLILEETGDRLAIDPGQRDIILSSELQEYMRTHAARNGNFLEWRKLDDDFTEEDLTTANLAKHWRDAYNRAKKDAKYSPSVKIGETPWYIVSDGVKYESKPLPKGPTALPDFLELVKKYGGN